MDNFSAPQAYIAEDETSFGATGTATVSTASPVTPVRDVPFSDPARVRPTFRPLKAWHHFRLLIQDKERTEEVFRIFEALPWRGFMDAARAFTTSEKGRAIRASEPYLPAILDDHAALRRLPAGSVAHAYCDFMESEGLSAQGLVDEYAKARADRPVFDDLVEWYANRMRDTHDLLHVLSGYGRDALGEQCVLAFTYSQQPSLGNLFIAYAGGMQISKDVGGKAPILRAIREGQKLGKACPRLIETSIRDLLAMPIDEARQKLGITPARVYAEAHNVWKHEGVDPYDLLAKAA